MNYSVVKFINAEGLKACDITAGLKLIGNGSMQNGMKEIMEMSLLQGRIEGCCVTGIVSFAVGLLIYGIYYQKLQDLIVKINQSENDNEKYAKKLQEEKKQLERKIEELQLSINGHE